MSDLLDMLADLERDDFTCSIKPGTKLRMLGHYGWPVAILTVTSVRMVKREFWTSEDVAITTTSDHPGPPWSSYNREWYGRWVLEHMAVLSHDLEGVAA